MQPADENTEILSVSQLNHQAKGLLENEFPSIWVEGEISNFVCPASGHWYFSLKDEKAQVRCAMFRGFNRLLGFTPEAGTQVLLRAKVSLYEGRGDFQLIVDNLEEAGFGALQRAFDALKKKLAQEGLFNPVHKQAIPSLPKCIGVITSSTGAAIRDIITTLRRRFTSIPIIVYPSLVQGGQAAANLCQAIATANQRQECDVLILARGGGSLEDLWPFNEESVARAIYASKLPIISGVGHEIDVTIADFVADVRAATPTAAAELACPNQQDWRSSMQQITARLCHLMQRQLQHFMQQLQWLQKRLQHPGQRLQALMQRVDIIEQRLWRASQHYLLTQQQHLSHWQQHLFLHNPLQRIQQQTQHLQLLRQRLTSLIQRRVQSEQHQLQQAATALDAISPLATLSRGYAIVTKQQDGSILRDATCINIGDTITAKLHQGEISCHVDATKH